jgi:hypothetical protein
MELPAPALENEVGAGPLATRPLREGTFRRAIGAIHRRGRELSAPGARGHAHILRERHDFPDVLGLAAQVFLAIHVTNPRSRWPATRQKCRRVWPHTEVFFCGGPSSRVRGRSLEMIVRLMAAANIG